MSLEEKLNNKVGLLSKIGGYLKKSLTSKFIAYSLTGFLAFGTAYTMLSSCGKDEKIEVKCQSDYDCNALTGSYKCISGKCVLESLIENEKCDNKDNNYGGSIDEGCDDDGDNYCDDSMITIGNPSTCYFGGGDCDDENVNINPKATEICNDYVDNNCDGKIDPNIDNDNDSYSAYSSCNGSKNDCDDNNQNINPGHYENRNNSIDDNCDGTINELLIEDFETRNFSKLPWVLSGASSWCVDCGIYVSDYNWNVTNYKPYSGSYSAESSNCSHNWGGSCYDRSLIKVSLETIAGNTTFKYNFDENDGMGCSALFKLDSEPSINLSGTGGNWVTYTVNINTAGVHNFQWWFGYCSIDPQHGMFLDDIIFP